MKTSKQKDSETENMKFFTLFHYFLNIFSKTFWKNFLQRIIKILLSLLMISATTTIMESNNTNQKISLDLPKNPYNLLLDRMINHNLLPSSESTTIISNISI